MNIRMQKAANKKNLERIRICDGIIFSGGNQTHLREIFRRTEFLSILKQRVYDDPEFVIPGTSVGAMAQRACIINDGLPAEALMRGNALITEGLGFIDTAIIDSHFVDRGRFGRLIVAVVEHPEMTGIGISEDTAVIITKNRYLKVIGLGLIVIMDVSKLRTNIIVAQTGEMLHFERVIFHLFSKGKTYDIQKKEIVSGALRLLLGSSDFSLCNRAIVSSAV